MNRYAIIINGQSAVGKTAVTRMLLPQLHTSRKIGVIHGDYLSNIVFPFNRSDAQLDLKYQNMASLIHNLAVQDYSLVINDLFRRDTDLKMIVKLLKQYDYQVLCLRLTATVETLASRNRCRDPLDYIPELEFGRMLLRDQCCSWPDEIVIDTENRALQSTFVQVLEEVKSFLEDR